MARMVVVYSTPDNPAEFDRHYFDVHIPLAKGLVGLEKYEISAGPVRMMGTAADAYLVAILSFPSMEAIQKAFASDLGKACAADRRILAPDDKVQMFLYEDRLV